MDKRILGDYTLLNKLGKGTLGETYLAEHRFIKKRFVVKILPNELSQDEEFVSRFESHISSLSSLDHPNIVKVHNVSFSDGCYYVVSDYIENERGEGENLSEYLQNSRKSLREDEVLDFLEQIASAMQYAHQQKVHGYQLTHRNLKLNNIIVKEVDGRPRPYITDFGIAMLIGEAHILTSMYKHLAELVGVDRNVNDSIATNTHQFFSGSFDHGKLSRLHFSFYQSYAFMAPEQRIFRGVQHTSSADVYAFGVLAYFLIMRSFPEGYFPLPSEIRSDFTLDWDALFKTALQPSPAKRPHSPLESLEGLKRSKRVLQQSTHVTQEEQKRSYQSTFDAAAQNHPPVYPYTPPQKVPSQQADMFQAPPPAPREPERPPLPTGVKYMSQPEKVAPMQQQPQSHMQPQTQMMHTQTATMQEVKANPEMLSQVSRMVQEEHKPHPVLNPPEIERPVYDPDPGKVFQMETTVAPYKPEEKQIKNVEPILTEMVVVKGGEFSRGSNGGVRDERPRHKIWLADYALDIHPVTNEQFVRFLEAMGGEKDSNNNDILKLRESRIKRMSGEYTIEAGYSKHPVIGITWYGATAYAKWVGKRLPTEAEFEIASRGGLVDATFPTGDDIDRSQANFFSSDTAPVLSYPSNGYGLYDMVGNVYEWCEDWYGYDYYEDSQQEPENPKGPAQGVYRVLRGGCWKSLKEDLRCAHRHRNNPATVNSTYGFRCCADVVRS